MNLNPGCPKLLFKQASKKADLKNASLVDSNTALFIALRLIASLTTTYKKKKKPLICRS